ncbi:hypothetical protein [Hymenobacter edaphi]|uniref:Uncharacterized protein n=1 Tax=Hymenobacter edaphi TaxID=2211146 RepID=A0A328BFK8_9BACT|nr:hypothetical protein [Hymenobacter edaphi]RAK64666.1 hypothetical protein DLM85_18460 [Hymenobacter edaphi]
MKVLVFPLLLGVAVVTAPPKPTRWTGTFSNGMKGAKISFDVSPDGKSLSDLTFQGYWRCAGKLELTTAGPTHRFPIQNGRASGVVVDPPNGGATAWRFEFDGDIGRKAAKGTFRMNINALNCDSYKLEWTAAPTP